MRRIITFGLVMSMCLPLACRKGRLDSPTGKPVPAFQGATPPDAETDAITPGLYGGTLVIATPTNPKTFNPVTAIETSSLWIMGDTMYKSLTAYDNYKQEDIPGLARSWETSADGLTWTFHLRRGVRWSDGEPFNSDDVLFTLQATFDPNVPSPNRDLLAQSDGSYPSVEKVDDNTVVFKLKEINPAFIASLNQVYLVPKHKWESAYKAGTLAQAIGVTTDPRDVVGLGPFRLVQYVPDQKVVLERNPYYWKTDPKGQRLPYVDRVIFLIVPNNNTWALKMIDGEIDTHFQIFPDQLDSITAGETKGDYKVYDLGPSLNTSYLAFNQDTGKAKDGTPYVDPVKLKWFRDVRFRQAVSYGIDREAMVKTVLNGKGVPIYGFDSPANKLWYTDTIPKYPYDPEKAKGLLKEMGIWDRNGDGIAEDEQGHPIRFSIITNSNNSVRVNMGTLIKDNLKKIGLDVDLQPIDLNLLQTRIQKTREFDAVIGTWQASVPPDPVGSKDIVMPSGVFYVAFPNQKSPSTDWEKDLIRNMELSSGTLDLANRQKYYWQAARVWSENLPEIDLIAGDYFVAAKNKLGNLEPSPMANYTYWNIDQLYFKY